MTISSRTPEGDPNICPVCGNDVRVDPSTTPTVDGPCPHCGHLLWFADGPQELYWLPLRGNKSYQGALLAAGRLRFGAIPGKLIHPLLEAVGKLTASRIRNQEDIEFVVDASTSWVDLTCRLRFMAGLNDHFSWAHRIRRIVRRLIPADGPAKLAKAIASED